MGKFFKRIRNLAILTGGTYLTYKLLAEKLFAAVFKKNDKFDEDYIEHKGWLNSSKRTQVYLKSYDGLKLSGLKIENNETDNYVVMVHGIWSSHSSMIDRAYEFNALGYNILLVDQRAAGNSEGEYYTYGLKESFDLFKWCYYLISGNRKVKIILYGVSMGAATVMQLCRFKLPENIKCIVEDCGFSSLKEQLAHTLQKDYKILKPNIVLSIFENIMYAKFGFKFDDISAKNSLRNNEIPILFIHGTDDDFVPFKMSTILYNSNKGYKKYYPVKDRKHARSFEDKNYYINVNNFIKNFI